MKKLINRKQNSELKKLKEELNIRNKNEYWNHHLSADEKIKKIKKQLTKASKEDIIGVYLYENYEHGNCYEIDDKNETVKWEPYPWSFRDFIKNIYRYKNDDETYSKEVIEYAKDFNITPKEMEEILFSIKCKL